MTIKGNHSHPQVDGTKRVPLGNWKNRQDQYASSLPIMAFATGAPMNRYHENQAPPILGGAILIPDPTGKGGSAD